MKVLHGKKVEKHIFKIFISVSYLLRSVEVILLVKNQAQLQNSHKCWLVKWKAGLLPRY